MHLSQCWDMTIDEVIEKNNLMKSVTNDDNNEGEGVVTTINNAVIMSEISYLSQMFGKQTFGNLTKLFVNQYSMILSKQLMINRDMELSKSKLITDFISCHLLVYSENNDFSHITNLIEKIRKLLF